MLKNKSIKKLNKIQNKQNHVMNHLWHLTVLMVCVTGCSRALYIIFFFKRALIKQFVTLFVNFKKRLNKEEIK